MTGSAFQALDVVVACWRKQKGGGLEEGGLQVGPDRREADDGKRFPAVDVVLALLLGENFLKMGGGPVGGGQKMTGSAF